MNKINAPWPWRVYDLVDEPSNQTNYCTVWGGILEISAQNDEVAHCIYSASWQDRRKIFADVKRWIWVTKIITITFL